MIDSRIPGVSREQGAINKRNKLESPKLLSDVPKGYRMAVRRMIKRESLILNLQILPFPAHAYCSYVALIVVVYSIVFVN